MRLTHQMKEEMISMQKRVLDLNDGIAKIIILAPFYNLHNTRVIKNHHSEEMKTYKIKLENFFSETDDNQEKEVVLKILLQVEDFLSHAPNVTDDFERYTTMGLQMVPNDPFFNIRKEKNIMTHYIMRSFVRNLFD